jgi:hypothetical protein
MQTPTTPIGAKTNRTTNAAVGVAVAAVPTPEHETAIERC